MIYEESDGAQDYSIMATDSLGNTEVYECNFTADGVCSLPPLACSKNLTFTLKAADQQCSSAPSNAVTVETGKINREIRQKVDVLQTLKLLFSGYIVPGFIFP